MEQYDVEALRREYPILERKVWEKPMIYLDNAATSQTPRCVVEAVDHMYFTQKANVHRGVHCMSQEATASMEAARECARRFVGADSTDEIIFTRGTTEALNLVASSYCRLLQPGDEIVLTVMEHHSNIVPWQMAAERLGLVIKAAPIHSDGSLDLEAFKALFSPRTRLASVCHVSNVLGTVNPIREIADFVHSHGAVMCVDGAQAVSHLKVDVKALGADFYAFSSHKMYGPAGVGILYGRRELLQAMPPYQGGGEMIKHVSFDGTTYADLPFKFEAGTPDFVDIAALGAALDFMEETGIEAIAAHERQLLEQATAGLMKVPGMHIYGTTPGKEAVISFNVEGIHNYDIGMLLDKQGVAVRTGHHCAQPLMERLGIPGTVRAGFAAYNTPEEVDAFLTALRRAVDILRP